VRDFPSLFFGTQGAPPSLLHVFFVVIAYYYFFFFSPGSGSVCPGGYADLAHGCRSTAYHLVHLVVCVFPSHLGAGVWRRRRSPPGFSV
jgi:hypothetical protein